MEDCFSVLSEGQKLAVEWFACDIHEPFISAAKKHLPNAKICVDRFHLVQLLNNAFDQTIPKSACFEATLWVARPRMEPTLSAALLQPQCYSQSSKPANSTT